jgi:hypothetical protein
MGWDTVIANALDIVKFILRRRKAGDQIVKVVGIYDNMNQVINNTAVERCLVIKAENGGGEIKPGSHLYASIVYEDFRGPLRTVKHKYQRVACDGEHMKLLMAMYVQGSARAFVETMPDSFLKDVYKAERIHYVEFYYLHHDKEAFYYCSMVTTKGGETFSDERFRTEIALAVNNIRNLFKK